jgi:hypothetical protein
LESATQGKARNELVEGFVAFHRMVCAVSGNARLMRVLGDLAIEVS